jgi:imidazolonepropionase-like amidohydrolase
MASMLVLRNARVVDGTDPSPRPGQDVLVEAGRIREVSATPIRARDAEVIDLGGRTLMPGLIDCHVHVTAVMADLAANARSPHTLNAYRSMFVLRDMLGRGFTTVRDAGGADHALAVAIDEGLIQGPRLFISGRALSQTGGHGDARGRYNEREQCLCCRRLGELARIADGVDGVRLAAREEIKAGAKQIKIMSSGGVASPTDPIAFLQYSPDEVRAIVGEAEAAQTYVMAHAYTAPAIRRAVENGVRSIEHGNLVDEDVARLMATRGAFCVPTLSTYEALATEGAQLGFPRESVAKIEDVRGAGQNALEIFKRAGVKLAYGTDLLGLMHRHQLREFELRREVYSNFELIQQATLLAAELLQQTGKLGVVAPEATADLLAVDGDPLTDIGVLGGQGEKLALIMQGGKVVKNKLA